MRSARAAVPLQASQTSAELRKAKAALDSALASLTQVERSADLEIGASEAALKQARSNAQLAAVNLKRQQQLQAQGYVAAAEVDSARTQAEVTSGQVEAAESNLRLTREKVAASVPAARDQVEQARASLAAAQAGTFQDTMRSEDLRSAESSLENARSAVTEAQESVRSAQADVHASRAQVSASINDMRSAQAAQRTALANMTQDRLKQQDIKAAYEAMRQSQAQVDYQRAQFAKSYIRSPFAGTVVTLAQQEGETVAAGLSAPTLMEVVALDRLEVSAYVDETDIGQVKVGQPAKVSVDAYPEREFDGKVTNIASSATTQNNVITYLVTIKFDKYPTGRLKPQMTANVQIEISRKENLLLVPNEAVKRKKGTTQVVVLTGEKGEVRDIQAGLSDDAMTEIVSGLREGEKVVLAGFDKLGIEGFSSAAEVPGFMRRSPLGMGGGATKGPKGGRGK